MMNDNAMRIHRKLLYYFENKIPVHINCSFGFRNGIILELNLDKKIVILNDKKIGETPILFEDIYEDSISRYREEWKND